LQSLKAVWKGLYRDLRTVIIAAAGKGTRMNIDINKQYIDICGMPMLARTIKVFEDCRHIDEIILVVNSGDIVYCKKDIVEYFGFNKVKTLVAGGSDRQGSVFQGLKEVNKNTGIVLIHDGARPFIKEESIIKSIRAAEEFGASCVAVPVKDTIKYSDSEGFINQTLDRSILWSIQTPQTFKFELILKAHEKAAKDSFLGTDDAVLVERLGFKIKLVPGDYSNIKITTQEDIVIAEAIVRNQS
jgi:2-C-methyl-D-erythritol 4-phosphate cytidylyltransferase